MSKIKELEKNKLQVEFEISADAISKAKVEAIKIRGSIWFPDFERAMLLRG
ncbi:MAG: hypothetical protein ACLVKR_05850 [Lachnospiraceae bacterium]